jgi:MFS family permease
MSAEESGWHSDIWLGRSWLSLVVGFETTMTEPGHLKPKTVLIILGFVALAFIVVCVSAGAWPLAVGMLIGIPLVPLVFSLLNLAGAAVFALIGAILRRILPLRFRAFATERTLHPSVVVLIFAALLGVLLLVFRSVVGVIGGLSVVAVLVGLPWLAEWSRQRKLKKAANKHLQPTPR